MNHKLLMSLVATPVVALFVGCSLEETPPTVVPPAGGSSGAGGGKSGGSGGVTSGGGGSGGAMGGSGGAMGGSGGTAGSGGAMGGSGGTAGSGGTGGTELTLTELVGGLDGHLVVVPCNGQGDTDDCDPEGFSINGGALQGCVNEQLTASMDYDIGGTPGTVYVAKMHFYGIMEPKNYGGSVTRESGSDRPQNNDDGASPEPYAWSTTPGSDYTTTDYNTYEVHVFDQNDVVVGDYFLNSDTQEGHYTFVIDYERDIEIIGGGRVQVRSFDNNCRQIKNCATGGNATQCVSLARSVDISGADPQPPAGSLEQPALGASAGNGHSGQWLLVDVVSFTPAP